MKFIEDKLEELDIYFAPKKESEKWMMIGGLAMAIGAAGYSLLLPVTEEMHKKSEREKKSIQKSIQDSQTYLNGISPNGNREFYVVKYTREIKNKNKLVTKYDNKIKFVDTNLEKLSDMLFNKRSWSKFLNSITRKAEVQNVELNYINNKYADNNGSFGHVLEIGVGCKGAYKNIIKFMNEIEQNVLVTDIYSTSLALDKNSSKIVADINISVWGVNH